MQYGAIQEKHPSFYVSSHTTNKTSLIALKADKKLKEESTSVMCKSRHLKPRSKYRVTPQRLAAYSLWIWGRYFSKCRKISLIYFCHKHSLHQKFKSAQVKPYFPHIQIWMVLFIFVPEFDSKAKNKNWHLESGGGFTNFWYMKQKDFGMWMKNELFSVLPPSLIQANRVKWLLTLEVPSYSTIKKY